MKNNLAALAGALALIFLQVHDAAAGHAVPADREFLTLKRDLLIPGPTTRDDVVLTMIGSIRVDGHGTIYVLDSKDMKVKMFGKDGSFIRSFGKAGQGPGEFQYPLKMFLRKNGDIAVFDGERMGLIGFSPDGDHLEDIDLRTVDQFFSPEAEDEAAVYGYRTIMAEAGRIDGASIKELVRFDKSTKTVSVISKFDNGTGLMKLDLLAGRFLLRTGKNGGLIWAFTKNYELFLGTASGQGKSSVTHKYPRLRVTEAGRKAQIKKLFGGEDKVPKHFKLVWPEYFPPISDIVLDDRDWLYVRTYENDAAGLSKYDVFDSAGVYRGSFHFGPEILEIRDGRAYARAEDAEGLPVLERYVISLTK